MMTPTKFPLVRADLIHLCFVPDDRFLEVAERLKDVLRGKLYRQWDYSSYRQYAEKELGLKSRSADYLATVANRIAALGLSREILRLVEPSKLRVILPHARTADEAKKWIERGRKMSYVKLVEAIRKDRAGRSKKASGA